MGLGLSKSFIIFLAFAVALGWYTYNFWNGVIIILLYAAVVIAWRLLR